MNARHVTHIDAGAFGMLPVVGRGEDRIVVRHPEYGEFALRLMADGRHTRIALDDYRAMLQRLAALRLHIA